MYTFMGLQYVNVLAKLFPETLGKRCLHCRSHHSISATDGTLQPLWYNNMKFKRSCKSRLLIYVHYAG